VDLSDSKGRAEYIIREGEANFFLEKKLFRTISKVRSCWLLTLVCLTADLAPSRRRVVTRPPRNDGPRKVLVAADVQTQLGCPLCADVQRIPVDGNHLAYYPPNAVPFHT